MTNQISIFSKIQNALPQMSEAKKSLGKYLIENWQEAAFLSASRIARNVGVSESVVVRFAQDLDYSGFPELQAALQKILRHRLTAMSSQTVAEMDNGGEVTKDPANAIQKVANLSIQNIQATVNSNSYETFLEAVELICKANQIVIVASRNALGPATILSVILNEVFTKSRVLAAGQDDVFDHLRSLTENDLLISIGLPGYSMSTVRACEFASSRGVPQIAITDSLGSPLATHAAVSLFTHYTSYSYATSHVATVFIIDVIIHLITIRDKGQVLKSLEELAELNQKYNLYLQG